mmetsp:Transcript_2833/g.11419  ORF Transcript_2833/g.11419 Transcript_2833/m.11419 type:complete len:233 (-) Transcript_2833:780-1478(-)
MLMLGVLAVSVAVIVVVRPRWLPRAAANAAGALADALPASSRPRPKRPLPRARAATAGDGTTPRSSLRAGAAAGGRTQRGRLRRGARQSRKDAGQAVALSGIWRGRRRGAIGRAAAATAACLALSRNTLRCAVPRLCPGRCLRPCRRGISLGKTKAARQRRVRRRQIQPRQRPPRARPARRRIPQRGECCDGGGAGPGPGSLSPPAEGGASPARGRRTAPQSPAGCAPAAQR